MARHLPDLYSLSPTNIQELINDLKLQQDSNARILYAVDPFEIFDFCFPVDPIKVAGGVDITTVADDQAALYEAFYRQKAFLLPEYRHELRRVVTYYRTTIDKMNNQSELVGRLIEEGKLALGEIPEDDEKQADFLRENFNIVLAIAMGIYSLGVTRLDDIYNSHLMKGDLELEDSEDKEAVRQISASFRPTDLTNIVYKHLTHAPKEYDENVANRQQRADGVDALAVDRLVYLNNALEAAYARDKLHHRYVILYLSSAPKTARVFNTSIINRFLPIIDGQEYHFWRTRAQIFAYVVHKSRSGNIGESIDNLEHVKEALEKIGKMATRFLSTQECTQCALTTHVSMKEFTPDHECRLSDFCVTVKRLDEEIQERRKELHNLGLMNTLSDYKKLRSATPKGQSQREYIEFFRNIFDNPLTEDARKKMQRLQQWIIVKSGFTNGFTEALGLGHILGRRSLLRAGKDYITGIDQYLPTKPRVTAEEYRRILETILRFYRDPSRIEFIEAAYKEYIGIDTEIRKINLEHELIRCFLYLALPRIEHDPRIEMESEAGDAKAYGHAKKLMETEQLMDKEEWDCPPEGIKQEFSYLLCWAARRIGEFDEATKYAQSGIEQDPNDPRFYHGLCLNIYSWLCANQGEEDESLYTLQRAIMYAETAIELYKEQAAGSENDEVIAANYNNLAYFWAWSVERMRYPTQGKSGLETDLESSDHFRHEVEEMNVGNNRHLLKGRKALKQLKDMIPQGTWIPQNHPEFFHTEAFLEYQEATVLWAAGDFEEAQIKLGFARDAIDNALSLYEEGPEYRKLKLAIENGSRILSARK